MAETAPAGAPQPVTARLDNIEALRALAVLSVMLFHYTVAYAPGYLNYGQPVWQATYGYMGVELFFVISGYCIYMTADRCPGLPLFWARRFSRLQPAFMASILLTFLVVRYYQLPDRQVDVVAAIANAFWLPALQLSPVVDGVYWSLMVELKLYIFFGLIFFGLRKRGDPVLWWTALCIAGAVTRNLDAAFNAGQFARGTFFFGTFVFPYSGFFLLGMLIYRWKSTPRWLKILAVPAYALCCIGTAESWTARALLFFLLPLSKFILDWKSMRVPRPLVFIGFISYPLYLLHNNIGVAIIRETAAAVPSEYARIGIAIALCIVLATVVSFSVEHRFRKQFERPLERLLAMIFGLPARLRPAPAH
jgi:peptidoglycan/LPS O-acetylase OafA/YrhL